MKLVVYTDGASRGNPGPASYGFTISDARGLVYQEGVCLGINTNNYAEYMAVVKSLGWIKNKFEKHLRQLTIEYFADSKLVVEQLSGRYKIKSENLKPLIAQIRKLEIYFYKISYNHVPREKNKEADRLANFALDNS